MDVDRIVELVDVLRVVELAVLLLVEVVVFSHSLAQGHHDGRGLTEDTAAVAD